LPVSVVHSLWGRLLSSGRNATARSHRTRRLSFSRWPSHGVLFPKESSGRLHPQNPIQNAVDVILGDGLKDDAAELVFEELTLVPAPIPCLRLSSAGTTSWPFDVKVALIPFMAYMIPEVRRLILTILTRTATARAARPGPCPTCRTRPLRTAAGRWK